MLRALQKGNNANDSAHRSDPEAERREGGTDAQKSLIKFLLKTRPKQRMVLKCNIPVIKRCPPPPSAPAAAGGADGDNNNRQQQGANKNRPAAVDVRGVPVPDENDYEVLVPEPKARPYEHALHMSADIACRYRNGWFSSPFEKTLTR